MATAEEAQEGGHMSQHAFPVVVKEGEDCFVEDGISTPEYYAIAMMQGLLAAGEHRVCSIEDLVKKAHDMAELLWEEHATREYERQKLQEEMRAAENG